MVMKQDEIWITKDGTKIKVGDMSEQHVRNVLRLILRKRRLKAEEAMATEDDYYHKWKYGNEWRDGHPLDFGDR